MENLPKPLRELLEAGYSVVASRTDITLPLKKTNMGNPRPINQRNQSYLEPTENTLPIQLKNASKRKKKPFLFDKFPHFQNLIS